MEGYTFAVSEASTGSLEGRLGSQEGLGGGRDAV